jgi:transposase InsO family protein
MGQSLLQMRLRNGLKKITLIHHTLPPVAHGRAVTLSRSIESYVMMFLNHEVLHSDKETKVIVENWRLEYNNHRLHSSLGYINQAAFVASCNLAVYVPPVGLRIKEYG